MKLKFIRLENVDSTNTFATEKARMGAEEGLCVTARRQTAGRGRYGRSWISHIDAGLYLSIVFRPRFEPVYYPLITFVSAIAVFDVLRDAGLDPDIKWANDVIVGGKKIAGILAEGTETILGPAVVAGIGINLSPQALPKDLADHATSMSGELGRSVNISAVTNALTTKLVQHYTILSSENGPKLILAEWRDRSSYYSGKKVRVTSGGMTFEGITDGLEHNGALRVMHERGELIIVDTGVVERVRMVDEVHD